jgi:iron(III) transport system ATP-binding protein
MSRLLEVEDLRVAYGANAVVRGLSFALPRGAIGCLLGPSGCGKTTVLRCIAGFEPAKAGRILLSGAVVSSPGSSIPPEKRRVGMVFQDYALFPHLTARGNIGFGLASENENRVSDLAELAGITQFLDKYPHELSGGQQQRVALARALAPRPELLLLDEPFSSLDTDLRERLSLELREIIKASGATAVLVTHDQQEAFAIADEIGVLHEGRIEQWDSPYNLYHRPASRFVADFVGQGVLLPARVLASGELEFELGILKGSFPRRNGGKVEVLLRPDDVVHDDASTMQAEVVHKAFRGAEILYTLKLESGRKLLTLVPSHHNHALGERIGIRLDVDHVIAFAPSGANS